MIPEFTQVKDLSYYEKKMVDLMEDAIQKAQKEGNDLAKRISLRLADAGLEIAKDDEEFPLNAFFMNSVANIATNMFLWGCKPISVAIANPPDTDEGHWAALVHTVAPSLTGNATHISCKLVEKVLVTKAAREEYAGAIRAYVQSALAAFVAGGRDGDDTEH